MLTRTFRFAIVILLATASGPVIAVEDVPQTIEFQGRQSIEDSLVAYSTVFAGPVRFQHTKHVEAYGVNCGDCHHDDFLEPIESYDPDETYTCTSCHDGEGFIRGPTAENELDPNERIERRANAVHALCLGCHKEFNKRQHLIVAPEACRSCHAKLE
jgi:hypothetical protein